MPNVQFAEIQTSGAAVFRWAAEHVCLASGSLHVLLAAILLVWTASQTLFRFAKSEFMHSTDPFVSDEPIVRSNFSINKL